MIRTVVLDATTAHTVHFVFEWLAIMLGVQCYRRIKHKRGQGRITDGRLFYISIGCILGAALGNKLVFLIEEPLRWQSQGWAALAEGQSIVGGLLGGLLGVEITKAILRKPASTGDDFVWPLVVGMSVGRIGCFLAGLHDGTFGNATTLPWGMDFGDGIARHPTQIYDMIFVWLMGGLLYMGRDVLRRESGLSFKIYLAGYLAWRLWIDGIKPIPYAYVWGWSGIQWVCFVALLLYLPLLVRQALRLRQSEQTLRQI